MEGKETYNLHIDEQLLQEMASGLTFNPLTGRFYGITVLQPDFFCFKFKILYEFVRLKG
jgi:hypothetical protein